MVVRVFISYRHSDGQHVAGRLRDRLADAFGAEHVFFDVESIAYGHDFRDVIRETLQQVDVVLSLIGPGFAPERLALPNDVVRFELATALELGVLVVPVLLGDTPMPAPDALPPDLEPLAYKRAAPLRHDPDFRSDVDRLVASIESTLAQRRAAPPVVADPGPVVAGPAAGPPFVAGAVVAGPPVVTEPGAAAGTRRSGRLADLDWAGLVPELLGRHHVKQVRALAFSPDGSLLASGGADRSVVVWDVASRTAVHRLTGPGGAVGAVAWSPDGARLAAGSADATLQVWRLGAEVVDELVATTHLGAVWSVAWSPDGTRIAGSSDRRVVVWDAGAGTVAATLEGHADEVRAVAWSPDGSLVAGGGRDETVRLWRPDTGDVVRTLGTPGHRVTSVAFSPDGRTLASGGRDNTVRLWDVATGRPLRALDHRPNGTDAVAWSPDGSVLAGAPTLHEVRLWDAADGSPLPSLTGHADWVHAVAFAPDGRHLASAGGGEYLRGDNLIRLWPLPLP